MTTPFFWGVAFSGGQALDALIQLLIKRIAAVGRADDIRLDGGYARHFSLPDGAAVLPASKDEKSVGPTLRYAGRIGSERASTALKKNRSAEPASHTISRLSNRLLSGDPP